ncbi:MAG: hypothetical protein ACI9YO_002811 [Gammaproteobacteria bacterium]|jgi:hypothetical protein
MIECEFLVQENNFGPSVLHELEKGTKDVVRKVLNMDANVTWKTVSEGNGFSAGEGGSKSSLLMLIVPEGTTDETRTELLAATNDLWVEKAGCHKNDLMISAFDHSLLS